MKKTTLLALITILSFSCSSDDDTNKTESQQTSEIYYKEGDEVTISNVVLEVYTTEDVYPAVKHSATIKNNLNKDIHLSLYFDVDNQDGKDTDFQVRAANYSYPVKEFCTTISALSTCSYHSDNFPDYGTQGLLDGTKSLKLKKIKYRIEDY